MVRWGTVKGRKAKQSKAQQSIASSFQLSSLESRALAALCVESRLFGPSRGPIALHSLAQARRRKRSPLRKILSFNLARRVQRRARGPRSRAILEAIKRVATRECCYYCFQACQCDSALLGASSASFSATFGARLSARRARRRKRCASRARATLNNRRATSNLVAPDTYSSRPRLCSAVGPWGSTAGSLDTMT